MFATLSFLLISAIIAVECTPIGYYEESNANEFVDQVLAAVKTEFGASLDPFHLPDTVAKFSKKIALITFHGDAKLTQGTITGLSHLARSGDSTIGTENEHFTAKLQLGDNNIHAHFNVRLDFMDLTTHLDLDADIANIDLKTTIGVDAAGKPMISSLDIDELKHVRIQVHGPVAPLDGVLDLLADAFIEVFNPLARTELSKVLKDIIGKEIANLHLPGTF